MEQTALYQLGAGGGNKVAANTQRLPTAVAAFNCPTRRPPQTFGRTDLLPYYYAPAPTSIPGQARTDYAACLGDSNLTVGTIPNEPTSYASVDSSAFSAWLPASSFTGVCFQHSEVTMAMISDGASNTYLLGEKFLTSDNYLNGMDGGDDFSMYTGFQDDIVRYRRLPGYEFSRPLRPIAAEARPT